MQPCSRLTTSRKYALWVQSESREGRPAPHLVAVGPDGYLSDEGTETRLKEWMSETNQQASLRLEVPEWRGVLSGWALPQQPCSRLIGQSSVSTAGLPLLSPRTPVAGVPAKLGPQRGAPGSCSLRVSRVPGTWLGGWALGDPSRAPTQGPYFPEGAHACTKAHADFRW